MFYRWTPLQESAVEDHLAAVAPGLQHLPGPIQLQNPPNPLHLHHNPFHNPRHNHKAASGEV
jgi:hypothetical protein